MKDYYLKIVICLCPSEFKVWFRDPKIRKNPIKVWVLATKHWKGIISALDAHTFTIYDSFGLLEKQDDDKVLSNVFFGYHPYIIDSIASIELSVPDVLEGGYSFSEMEERLDQYYKADKFKKKRIYEASNHQPFVSWKLEGDIPFPGPHAFQKKLIFLWTFLPASSYKGLKKLDLLITKECLIWDKMDNESKQSFILIFRFCLGTLFWIIACVITGLINLKHPLTFLVFTLLSFYFPYKIIK